jgi:ribitol-5-phosphate 2-dehydrogenase (NADP+) / D-ribitol-5-phosphate cytidylyltransferase
MNNTVVILLSGSGIRFGLSTPKQFIKIKGSPLFTYSLIAFHENKFIDEIVLVVNPLYLADVKGYLKESGYLFSKPIKVIEGGNTRQLSSFLGVSAVTNNDSRVLIHDAVRPFIKQSIINECIIQLDSYMAVSTVLPVTDTLYFKDKDDHIIDIPERDNFVRAQTPQGFHLDTILSAHKFAQQDGIANAPDDCYLVKKYNLAEIGMIAGDINNIKITYPIDIDIAETFLDKYYEI